MDLLPCRWKLESISLFFNRNMNLERTNLFIIKLLKRTSSIEIQHAEYDLITNIEDVFYMLLIVLYMYCFFSLI